MCVAVNSIQLLHFMLVVTGAALLGMTAYLMYPEMLHPR